MSITNTSATPATSVAELERLKTLHNGARRSS